MFWSQGVSVRYIIVRLVSLPDVTITGNQRQIQTALSCKTGLHLMFENADLKHKIIS